MDIPEFTSHDGTVRPARAARSNSLRTRLGDKSVSLSAEQRQKVGPTVCIGARPSEDFVAGLLGAPEYPHLAGNPPSESGHQGKSWQLASVSHAAQ